MKSSYISVLSTCSINTRVTVDLFMKSSYISVINANSTINRVAVDFSMKSAYICARIFSFLQGILANFTLSHHIMPFNIQSNPTTHIFRQIPIFQNQFGNTNTQQFSIGKSARNYHIAP